MVSDDHEGIKAAIFSELPGARWQRCAVHFEHNVLSHVPATSMAEVAQDLSAIFKVRRVKTAKALAEEFMELYGKRFPKAVSVFEAGIEDALTYLSFPGSHHAKLRTTNMLERHLQGGQEEDEGGRGLPERDEREHLGNRDSFEEQRGMGSKPLPHDGCSRGSRKTQPTTHSRH